MSPLKTAAVFMLWEETCIVKQSGVSYPDSITANVFTCSSLCRYSAPRFISWQCGWERSSLQAQLKTWKIFHVICYFLSFRSPPLVLLMCVLISKLVSWISESFDVKLNTMEGKTPYSYSLWLGEWRKIYCILGMWGRWTLVMWYIDWWWVYWSVILGTRVVILDYIK